MPFARSTLSDLLSQAQADLAAALPGTDPQLRYANLKVLAKILAEGVNGAFAYLDYIARQAVPFTARDEALEGWAALKGVTRKPAVAAAGFGIWQGTPTRVIPAGTPVSRGDGEAYVTTADAAVGGGGTVTAPLVAVKAGASGSLVAGSLLVLGAAVAGIAASGAVAAGGTPGVDVEDFEAFRTRTLTIYAQPPQGGAKPDYEEWALQVAGVTRAWCVPLGKGAGTVSVYFMMDVAEAAFSGFPQGVNGVAAAEPRAVAAQGDQLLVANHIIPLRPVTALVYALAPIADPVAMTIDLLTPSAALKAAILDAIRAVLLAYASPGGMVTLSKVESAIAALAGADGFVITSVSIDYGTISPVTGNVTASPGYLPVLGVVTWV